MPRVVPSDVVKAADRMFPEMAKDSRAFQNISPVELPSLVALASLAASVPDELIVLQPGRYAGLVASIAYLQATPEVFSSGRVAPATVLRMRNFDENPIALIHAAMASCPDQAPTQTTTALAFITDPQLRDSIRLDISGAHRNLAQAEWKGATVLAGSAIEALLLWALQDYEKRNAGSLATTIAALVANRTWTQNPGPDPEGAGWHLTQYVEAALQMKLIKDDTAKLVRLAKDFRNLIHPGRAARVGQTCDHSTALTALGAMEAVARDLG